MTVSVKTVIADQAALCELVDSAIACYEDAGLSLGDDCFVDRTYSVSYSLLHHHDEGYTGLIVLRESNDSLENQFVTAYRYPDQLQAQADFQMILKAYFEVRPERFLEVALDTLKRQL